MRKLSLLQKFALVSILPMVLLGIVLARALESQIRERALANAVDAAQLIATLGIQPQLVGADLSDGLSSEHIEELDEALGGGFLEGKLASIKIWNSAFGIVYSDDHSLIGEGSAESASEGLREALGGNTVSEILSGEEGEAGEEGEEVDVGTEQLLGTYGELLEVYVPIRFEPGGPPSGAFEMYLPYRPIATTISGDTRRDQLLLIGGLALLYAALFRIVAGASKQLRRQAQSEREAAQRLRELDDMKNTFLAAVSHELRTRLAAILGCAVTLNHAGETKLSADDSRDLTLRLESNARKLNRLLSDLLDLERLVQGILEPKRVPTDVSSLVRGVIDETEVVGQRTLHVEAEPVVVAVDPVKVERIAENMIANAIRHTTSGTNLWVRVLPEEDGVLLVVEDDGPGVPEQLRQEIFKPFRRGPDGPSHSPGVGVGLSLVAQFAELHGGRAWVEERPGGGASFRVFLPGDRAPAVAMAVG